MNKILITLVLLIIILGYLYLLVNVSKENNILIIKILNQH